MSEPPRNGATSRDDSRPLAPVAPWGDRLLPEETWQTASILAGAFHDVILGERHVVRAARGLRHRERAAAEWRTLGIIEDLEIAMQRPRRVVAPRTHEGGTAYAITRVSGATADSLPNWEDTRAEYVRLIDELAAAPTNLDLDPARTWCGGSDFLRVLERDLAPTLGQFSSLACESVEALTATLGPARSLVHGDFGPHNIMWSNDEALGLVDWDHACVGDVAMDIAPLVGVYGAAVVRSAFSDDLVERAKIHRSTLSLQVAAAAHRIGDASLRAHALGNFVERASAGTLHDPNGEPPDVTMYGRSHG